MRVAQVRPTLWRPDPSRRSRPDVRPPRGLPRLLGGGVGRNAKVAQERAVRRYPASRSWLPFNSPEDDEGLNELLRRRENNVPAFRWGPSWPGNERYATTRSCSSNSCRRLTPSLRIGRALRSVTSAALAAFSSASEKKR